MIMGFFVFCCAPRLQIEGVHRGHAGDTSLLIALDPLITALGAALFLRERILPRRWWGFGLGMFGVLLLSRVWGGEVQPLIGLGANLLFLSSFVCETAYSVMGKPLLERVNPLKLLAVGLWSGTAANLLITGAGGSQPWSALAQVPVGGFLLLGYMALICTVAGYALWYWVIRDCEVNVAGLTVFVQPVAALMLSVVWLGEPLHWGQLWGSTVIVLGLLVGLKPDLRWAESVGSMLTLPGRLAVLRWKAALVPGDEPRGK
jgi:drug/metabolite transporter (DMT)-like permease